MDCVDNIVYKYNSRLTFVVIIVPNKAKQSYNKTHNLKYLLENITTIYEFVPWKNVTNQVAIIQLSDINYFLKLLILHSSKIGF